MVLHVLARGQVSPAATELLGDARELFHLWRRQQPAGNFAAHHLDARLPLPIDPMLEPEGTEVVLRNLPGLESRGLPAEDFDFLTNGPIMLLLEHFALR